jgi:cell division protein FtsB
MKMKKRSLLLLFLFFILVLGVLIVFGDKGILHRLRLQKELARIRETNGKMTEESERLKEEARRLKTERKYIEEIARKELGMVKEGEIVYQFDTTGGNKENSK